MSSKFLPRHTGFLAGLVEGLGGAGRSIDAMPDEAREIVRDFSSIVEVDTEDAGVEGEADLLQLQEFVKVGALLLLSLADDDGIDTAE